MLAIAHRRKLFHVSRVFQFCFRMTTKDSGMLGYVMTAGVFGPPAFIIKGREYSGGFFHTISGSARLKHD